MAFFFAPLVPCSYDAIMIDPPTEHRGFTPFEGDKGAPYMTMSDEWVRQLPVKNLARADCLLWLWTTMPKLAFSIDLMREDWGCRFVTAGAWFKRTSGGKIAYGTGKVLQSGAEVFLLGAWGRPKYPGRPIKGVIETDEEFDTGLAAAFHATGAEALNGLRREHSRKPDIQYERIRQLMGPDARICDLFGRTDAPGIESWGDQTGTFKAENDDA